MRKFASLIDERNKKENVLLEGCLIPFKNQFCLLDVINLDH
jgi:hypothetical protein